MKTHYLILIIVVVLALIWAHKNGKLSALQGMLPGGTATHG